MNGSVILLLGEDVAEGVVELVAAALHDHAPERPSVAPHRDRSACVGAHRRRRQREDRFAQRCDARHQALPLLSSVGAAIGVELGHEVVGADGRRERTLRQVGAPSIVGEPLRLLADDLEHMLERVG